MNTTKLELVVASKLKECYHCAALIYTILFRSWLYSAK